MFKFGKKKNKLVENDMRDKVLIVNFDEDAYLEANPDVVEAIENGQFKDVQHHLELFGLNEIQKGVRKFHRDLEPYDESLYIDYFSDRDELISKGDYGSAFEHFCDCGYSELISNIAKEQEKFDTEEVIKITINNFDEEAYLYANPDVVEAIENGQFKDVQHHLEIFGLDEIQKGLRKFHNDYEPFDESLYLSNCPPLKKLIELEEIKSGFDHFIATGYVEIIYEEKREWPKIEIVNMVKDDPKIEQAKILDLNSEVLNIIESQFDKTYYLSEYPDIELANIDPLLHFIGTGWREGRNPNKFFDTKYYLNSNPDIKGLGINPFYHYISTGKAEGRIALHPAGYKARILNNLKNVNHIADERKKEFDVDSSVESLTEKMNNILSKDRKGVVFSFSHDRYIRHVGGVQICVSEEEQQVKKKKYTYIHISPLQPLLILANQKEEWYANIIIDGEEIGVYSEGDILYVFQCFFKKEENLSLIIHALHGHKITFIENLYNNTNIKKSFIWIHDYFTLCQGYHLLRNDITFCHAPSLKSQGCHICVYGEYRSKHINDIEKLFDTIPFIVLSPSKYALKLWKKSTNVKYIDSRVVNHRSIKQGVQKELKQDVLNIAYLGYPVNHKGWFVYANMVDKFSTDQRYNFYHLGIGQVKTCPVKFQEVRSSWDDLSAMTKVLEENEIDVVFLWSIWPETYNITMYEALSSGTIIITNKNSGNIVDEIKKSGHGIVYDDEKAMFDDIENGKMLETIRNIFDKGIYKGSLSSSGITAPLITKKVKKWKKKK